MSHNENSKRYDLEERTFEFAKISRAFVKQLPRTISNLEDAKQFIRASGSIGANYIEANEAIGRKDFLMKIKICRREAKESRYWLRLIDTDGKLERDQAQLLNEAQELKNLRRNRSQIRAMSISEFGIPHQTTQTLSTFRSFPAFEFLTLVSDFADVVEGNPKPEYRVP